MKLHSDTSNPNSIKTSYFVSFFIFSLDQERPKSSLNGENNGVSEAILRIMPLSKIYKCNNGFHHTYESSLSSPELPPLFLS